MINNGRDLLTIAYNKATRLDKDNKEQLKTKYLQKNIVFRKTNVNVGVDECMEFDFNGLKNSYANIKLNLDILRDVEYKVYLNNVLIIKDNLTKASFDFSGYISENNVIKILFKGETLVNRINVKINANVFEIKSPFTYRVSSNNAGIMLVENIDNGKSVNQFSTIADFAESFYNMGDVYNTSECIDYVYSFDESGIKSQRLKLSFNNQLILSNETQNAQISLGTVYDHACICPSKTSICRVIVSSGNNLICKTINYDNTYSEMSFIPQIEGKITKLIGLEGFTKGISGFAILTDLNNGYLYLCDEIANEYKLYEKQKNINDIQVYEMDKNYYMILKREEGIISVLGRQICESKYALTRDIYDINLYNCDYAFIYDNKIYTLNNNLCSEGNAIDL